VNHSGLMTLPDLLRDPYFAEFRMARPVQPVNIRNVLGPKKVKTPSPPTKLKTPSPPKKKKTPSPASGGPCGKKARPVGGVGAERLTTKEMLELIKRKGYPGQSLRRHQAPQAECTDTRGSTASGPGSGSGSSCDCAPPTPGCDRHGWGPHGSQGVRQGARCHRHPAFRGARLED
jgi:hypothetical protein